MLYGIGILEKDGRIRVSAKKGNYYFCMARKSRLELAHPNVCYVLMYFTKNGEAKRIG